MWNKTSPGEPANVKRTRRDIARQITVGGLGPVFYGTPEEVTDEIQRWVDISDVDGFNVTYAISPGTFEDFVEKLFHCFRKRINTKDYPQDLDHSLTFREQLFGSDRKNLIIY